MKDTSRLLDVGRAVSLSFKGQTRRIRRKALDIEELDMVQGKVVLRVDTADLVAYRSPQDIAGGIHVKDLGQWLVDIIPKEVCTAAAALGTRWACSSCRQEIPEPSTP